MMIPVGVEASLFGLVVVLVVFAALTSAERMMFLCGAVLPLMTPRLSLGIGIDWYKVVGPLAVALVFFRTARRGEPHAARVPGFGTFLLYSVIVTGVWMVLEYNVLQRYRVAEAMDLGGDGQTIYKMPVQLGSFVGQAVCVYIAPTWARSLREARAGVAGFLAGCAVSSAVGLAAWVVFGSGTINSRPERGAVPLGEVEFSRLGGLSGEPKFLGACLAMAVTLALTTLIFRGPGPGTSVRAPRALLVASVLVLAATLSTSAWAAAGGAFVVVSILAFARWRESRVMPLVLVWGVAFLLVSGVGIVGALVEARFVNRLFGQASEISKQKDFYVYEVFRDNPTDILFGYGLGGGDLAVLPYMETLHLQYRRTPTPGVTGVRLLADLGVAGVVLLCVSVMRWFGLLMRARLVPHAVFAIAGLAAALSSSIIGLSSYFFLLGCALVEANVQGADEPWERGATLGAMPA